VRWWGEMVGAIWRGLDGAGKKRARQKVKPARPIVCAAPIWGRSRGLKSKGLKSGGLKSGGLKSRGLKSRGA